MNEIIAESPSPEIAVQAPTRKVLLNKHKPSNHSINNDAAKPATKPQTANAGTQLHPLIVSKSPQESSHLSRAASGRTSIELIL